MELRIMVVEHSVFSTFFQVMKLFLRRCVAQSGYWMHGVKLGIGVMRLTVDLAAKTMANIQTLTIAFSPPPSVFAWS